MTGNDSQDGMVFYLKLSQWYTKKDDNNTPKLVDSVSVILVCTWPTTLHLHVAVFEPV